MIFDFCIFLVFDQIDKSESNVYVCWRFCFFDVLYNNLQPKKFDEYIVNRFCYSSLIVKEFSLQEVQTALSLDSVNFLQSLSHSVRYSLHFFVILLRVFDTYMNTGLVNERLII